MVVRTRSPEWGQVEGTLAACAKVLAANANATLLIYVDGGLSTSDVSGLKVVRGCSVLASGKYDSGSVVGRFVQLVLPSYYALVEFEDYSNIVPFVDDVTDQQAAYIAIMSEPLTSAQRQQIQALSSGNLFIDWVRKSDPLLLYIIDTDSCESSTGVVDHIELSEESASYFAGV